MSGIASASAIVLTVLQKAGAAVDQIQQVQAFVTSAVQLAEQTGRSGEDKLSAVLNATQVFMAAALPQVRADWNALAVQVKGFVAGLVALWNALGVFVKDVGNAINGAIHAVEGTISPNPT